jgi:divalent metal cation (Fe/Co/Zn/Cd) transporter
VLVDPELTVRQGHDVATAVEESVRRVAPDVLDVTVHIEPCEVAPGQGQAGPQRET